MGNWVIIIEGTGAHHNGDPKVDADLAMVKFVEELQDSGQHLDHVSFTYGGRVSD